MGEFHYHVWLAITRLGESEILLPAFVAGALWLAFARPAGADGPDAVVRPTRATAWRWVVGIFLATCVTTVSKIAFLGFGIGSAALDFTGFSGHSMYSTGILPVLGAIILGRKGAALGILLALVVMLSRVVIGAHSWSEALTGMLLGAAVSAWTLSALFRRTTVLRAPLWLPAAFAAWMLTLTNTMTHSPAHGVVIAVSLELSGRSQPYTREELLAGLIRPPEPTL